MKILGVIPARYASTRFPGKPLADICGKSMIQRVYEQAAKAKTLSKVVVATDDDRIHEHVNSFGGNVLLTSNNHRSGTDRCAEVAEQFPEFEALINIQGDEPLIEPRQIDLLGTKLLEAGVDLATLIKEIIDQDELLNPNIPKVVCNTKAEAMYFSRQPIPFLRGIPIDKWLQRQTFYKHIGIYGYKTKTLGHITQLAESPLERSECLEQLRWIENGYVVHTVLTDSETRAVDTPEDLAHLIHFIQKQGQ